MEGFQEPFRGLGRCHDRVGGFCRSSYEAAAVVEDVGCVVVVEQVVAADPESPVSFGLGLCAETCQAWQVEYPGHATRFFVRVEVSQLERSVL